MVSVKATKDWRSALADSYLSDITAQFTENGAWQQKTAQDVLTEFKRCRSETEEDSPAVSLTDLQKSSKRHLAFLKRRQLTGFELYERAQVVDRLIRQAIGLDAKHAGEAFDHLPGVSSTKRSRHV